MTMHLNGGSKFSQLNYALQCDGEATGIARITRTSGSSTGYLKTVDELHAGDEVFDVLATKGVGAIEWLEARHPKKASLSPPAGPE